MKKLISSMLMLLCATTTLWADVTDLPEMSTEGNIKLYKIKKANNHSKHATYTKDNAANALFDMNGANSVNAVSFASYFYFTGSVTDGVATVKIHNIAAGSKKFATSNTWTDDGSDWYIASKTDKGVSISKNADFSGNNSWNDAGGHGKYVDYWNATDGGSQWIIEAVDVSVDAITSVKTATITKVENLSKVTCLFPAKDDYIAQIDAVDNNGGATSLMAIADILFSYVKTVNNMSVKLANVGNLNLNQDDPRRGRFLGYDASNNRPAGVVTDDNGGWWTLEVVAREYVKLYNWLNNFYIGYPDDPTPKANNFNDAPSYNIIPTDENRVAFVASNGNMIHLANNNNYKLMSYYSLIDGASLWNVTAHGELVSRDKYNTDKIDKVNTFAQTVQGTFGLVTDASNYYSNYMSTQEGSYEDLLDESYANDSYFHSAYGNEPGDGSGVHYIQANFGKPVNGFYFYMAPRAGNGNNRPVNITVSGSNNDTDYEEIGTVTTTLDGTMTPYISAKLGEKEYQYVRLTVTSTNSGTKFFTLSELYFFPASEDVNNLMEYYEAFKNASIIAEEWNEKVQELENVVTILVDEAKEAAKTKINNYAQLSNIFPEADSYISQIEAKESALKSLAEIDTIIANYINTASDKYVTINTPERNNGYMQMTATKVVGTATAAAPTNVWQFVNYNGSLNIYNPYTGLYMCATGNNSEVVNVTDEQANAGAYTFTINDENPSNQDEKVKIGVNGANVHMDGYSNLVRWDNGGASEWTVTLIEDFSTIIDAYKTSTINTLDNWATLSVVFDAELIASAKTAINAINTNSYATFAEIDATLEDVTDAVAEKMFTFRNTDTANSNRIDAYLSVNASTNKGCGSKTFDYNAIWSLRHASGTSFYLYNELNEVYLASPSNGGLTTDAVAAYSFEIIDAETNKAELKCGNETLHLAGGLGLMNYDNEDPASRWEIATFNVTADITAILESLTEDDYADVPALGQYTTAAYEALVEAERTAMTVEAAEQAITAFKKAKNAPVYIITSAWENSYATGKAILYNGTDWRVETANKYNKQMWMTIPAHNAEAAPIVDAYDTNGTSYEICDYLTGHVMRDYKVQIVKIDGWENAYSLQYDANAESLNSAQHAKDNGALVGWKPATANDCQASAWTLEFIGGTYDLDNLTDEHITALVALQNAYNAKAPYADAVIGDAIGQYEGSKDALVAAKTDAETISAKSLVEQSKMSIEEINAVATALNNGATALTLNMPVEGNYYKLNCLDGGKYLSSVISGNNSRLTMTETEDKTTIYYYDGTSLLSYATGQTINAYNLNAIGTNTTVTFTAANNGTVGKYNIKLGERAIYGAGNNIDSGTGDPDNRDGYVWTIEEVTELPVTITDAGYASFYAPVAVTVPSEIEAYYLTTIIGEFASMTKIEGTIPANTGVMLTGTNGEPAESKTYNFTITDDIDPIEDNMFNGSVAATYVTDEAYVLAVGTNGVGLYLTEFNVSTNTENDGTAEEPSITYEAWKNNSHKAYLPESALHPSAQMSAGFRFRFDGGVTTPIDEVEYENGEVKEIYDLTGRKLQGISGAGIYIIDGKKVLIK